MTELLAAAELDMQWHMLAGERAAAESRRLRDARRSRRRIWTSAMCRPRYRSSYFSHIWGGGYAAGYYAYLWTQMLADDGYEWFIEHGGLTAKTAIASARWSSRAATPRTLAKMYEKWRVTAPPNTKAMLKYRGLENLTEIQNNRDRESRNK